MRNFRKIAGILLLIFIINFIPVSADVWTWDSKFGISGVSYEELEGKRNLYVNFRFSSIYNNAKEIKLYTKVVNYNWDYENSKNIKEVIDGPTVVLNQKLDEERRIKGILDESQINNFGSYEVDRIEVFLNDGSKKVSYNGNYHTSLSDNDKENGEIINIYGNIFRQEIPLYLIEEKFEFSKIKLGQDQNYTFNIETNKAWIYPSEVYVAFIKEDDDGNREQIVKAEKLDNSKYIAKLNLTNSLDTGKWKVSKVNIVDNYSRNYELENSNRDYFEVVSTNTDIEVPKLNGIEISSNIYDAKEGTPITFSLDVSDDISGFKYAYISISNGDLQKNVWIFNHDYYENKYISSYEDFRKNGIWKIESIYIVDNAGNYITYVQELKNYMINNDKYIERDFSSYQIEVINFEKNHNIEILEIINNSPEVSNGKEIDLKIKLKANVKLLTMDVHYTGENSSKYFYLDKYNSGYDENGNIVADEDGTYTFNIIGDKDGLEYLATDSYMCKYIIVGYRDEYGNFYNKYFNNKDFINIWNENCEEVDLSELQITCNNLNEDITKPEIVDIYAEKQVILLGEAIELKIKVSDDKSGFNNWNVIDIDYDRLSLQNIEYSFDKDNLIYTIKINVPEYCTTGKYKISSIRLYDKVLNYRYYNWYNEEDRNLLSKGTILVKSDLNEMMPPEIITDIEDGKEYVAPFIPNISSDHGYIKMYLDGQDYKLGEPINKIGNHQLYIEAIGIDGSKSTKLVNFRVKGEINNQTKPEDIINQIISSEDKVVEVEVNNESKEIDKSIFEAIKGEDKIVNFKQEDGTIWSFNGKDISDENLADIGNLKISVSSVAEEENKEHIENLDSDARVIHFDHHGALPGKATVKVKVDNPEALIGKELTFYYFNSETQKAEKVQGPLSIDSEGYVTVEIEHCSDYFLSTDDTLHLEDPVIIVEKEEIELEEGETEYINAKVTPEDIELEYSSSNENIAIISEDGLITAKAEGETKIIIKAKDVIKEVKVKVNKREIKPGDTEDSEDTNNPEDEDNIVEIPEFIENIIVSDVISKGKGNGSIELPLYLEVNNVSLESFEIFLTKLNKLNPIIIEKGSEIDYTIYKIKVKDTSILDKIIKLLKKSTLNEAYIYLKVSTSLDNANSIISKINETIKLENSTPGEDDENQEDGGVITPDGDDENQEDGGVITPDGDDENQGDGGVITPDGDDENQGDEGVITPGEDDENQEDGGVITPGEDDENQGDGGVITPGEDDENQGDGGVITPGEDGENQEDGGVITPDGDDENKDENETITIPNGNSNSNENTGNELNNNQNNNSNLPVTGGRNVKPIAIFAVIIVGAGVYLLFKNKKK